LAISGCDGTKETSVVYTPGYWGVPAPTEIHEISNSEDGTEIAVTPESGEGTSAAPTGPGDDPGSVLPDGSAFGRNESPLFGFRAVDGSVLRRYFEPSLPVGGPIAMPAPTREYRLTGLRWIHLNDSSLREIQVLNCSDEAERSARVLIGLSGRYDEETGDLIGFEKTCGELFPDGRATFEADPDVRLTGSQCSEGEALFGAILKYDPSSRNFVLMDVGCAKPAWVPVNE
jgi:hypothetical protein